MIQLYVLAGAVAVAGAGLAYMQGRSDGRALCVAADAREREVAAIAHAAAASAAAAAISRIRVQHQTIRQEVEREIRTNTVYADCRHSAEQLQRINAAIAGRARVPSGGELPGADAAGR